MFVFLHPYEKKTVSISSDLRTYFGHLFTFKCFIAVGNAYCYKITFVSMLFSRCIPWIFGIIYILTIFHLNRISDLWIALFSILNWLISLESHITLNFLFYVLNVPNRLSGIARVLSYCCVLNLRIQCRPSAFLVLFIDVHSIDNTFGIKHVPASIQSFCPGYCFSVSG